MNLKPAVAGLRKEGYKVDMILAGNNSRTKKYEIKYLPTFIYVENGKEIRRKVGAISKGSMKSMCSSSWF